MYEPTKQIDQFLIAGFQYHDGADVLNKLEVGTKLDLVPEFDNPYDPNAVAISHKDVVRCKVIQRDEKADPREQVRVKLYLKDKR